MEAAGFVYTGLSVKNELLRQTKGGVSNAAWSITRPIKSR
jgi:hypothetical protein